MPIQKIVARYSPVLNTVSNRCLETFLRQWRHRILALLVLLPVCGDALSAERIVSLDLCTDWMLAHYGNPAQIAALSPMHRRYPVDWLATNRPFHDGSLEQILELKPDLVITGQYNALLLRGRLKSLGFRVAVFPLPTTLEQVTEYEKLLLSLIGLSPNLASVPPPARPQSHIPKQLLLLGANGIGTGQGTFENALLERAGWRNYLKAEGYLRMDLENIVTTPPDAILWSAPLNNALANHFAEHPVLQQKHIQRLKTEYWRWECPGPWTWELIRELEQWHE
jgi:iron complex transport system substrate-binding protein